VGVSRRDGPLIVTTVAYCVLHHLGSVPDGFGSAGRGTRWADWLDLLVPFVVLLPALGTLLAAGVSRATYVWFAIGSWLYTTGHGIHLSANSIGNAAPGETAHLWDEQVGHWLWYAGVAVVVATLASTLTDRPPTRHALALALALGLGLTWGTNAEGGHFAWPSLVLDALALWWGWRHRGDRGGLLLVVAVAGALGVGLAGVR
jgi:hypothetical protein